MRMVLLETPRNGAPEEETFVVALIGAHGLPLLQVGHDLRRYFCHRPIPLIINMFRPTTGNTGNIYIDSRAPPNFYYLGTRIPSNPGLSTSHCALEFQREVKRLRACDHFRRGLIAPFV